ncbi:hypothetical protein SO802_027436 [Lithocarpus litseifolius]|uniref:Uncharacterized protein n=1 Tax=Lithocarpus litseifolius TaxID=425828 RepID=A0AAW2C2L1_9ROSI
MIVRKLFELWKYVEGLHQISVTCKDLLAKHDTMVSECLTAHYDEFFNLYENLLTSANYVTRRQSLRASKFPYNEALHFRSSVLKVMMTLLKKDSSKTIQMSAFHIFKVFVANPNKPREVKVILAKSHEKLLELLHNLSPGKGIVFLAVYLLVSSTLALD